MIYKPSFISFLGSSLFGLTPAICAGFYMYFLADTSSMILWIVSGFMFFISFVLFLQTVVVHLSKLYMDDSGIVIGGPLFRSGVRWQDVTSAELRERENTMSRTDRLVIIKSVKNSLSFNISILSRQREEEVIGVLRAHTNLVVQRDKPSI